jgi:fatty-acid desaturase
MKNTYPKPNKVSFIMWATEHPIYRAYADTDRDIANKALSHAWDWINSQSMNIEKENEVLLKKSCKKYIKMNFRPYPSTYGCFCFSIYFYFVVNSIFNWVSKRTVSDLLLNNPYFLKKPNLK